MAIFGSMLHGFFAFFSGVLDRIVLILVWFEDLFTLHALADKVALVHRLMTSQAVEGTWIRTGGSGANGLSWTIFLWYLLVGYLVGELRGCLTSPFSLYGSVHSDRATFNFVDHPVTVNILFSECNANGVRRRMIRVSFWFPLYVLFRKS